MKKCFLVTYITLSLITSFRECYVFFILGYVLVIFSDLSPLSKSKCHWDCPTQESLSLDSLKLLKRSLQDFKVGGKMFIIYTKSNIKTNLINHNNISPKNVLIISTDSEANNDIDLSSLCLHILTQSQWWRHLLTTWCLVAHPVDLSRLPHNIASLFHPLWLSYSPVSSWNVASDPTATLEGKNTIIHT